MDTAHAHCAHNYPVLPPPTTTATNPPTTPPSSASAADINKGAERVARCGLILSQQVTSFHDALWFFREGLLSSESDPQQPQQGNRRHFHVFARLFPTVASEEMKCGIY